MRPLVSRIASRCPLHRIPLFSPTRRLGRPIQSLSAAHQPLRFNRVHKIPSVLQTRLSHTAVTTENAEPDEVEDIPQPSYVKPGAETLPIACPGCGAFTQWVEPEEAGFYSFNRRAVKQYIKRALSERDGHGADEAESVESTERPSGEEAVAEKVESQANATSAGSSVAPASEDVSAAGKNERAIDEEIVGSEASPTAPTSSPDNGSVPMEETRERGETTTGEVPGLNTEESAVGQDYEKGVQIAVDPVSAQAKPDELPDNAAPLPLPLCDRCHYIEHHNTFKPIPFPPISYIRDVMDESPFDHNHVYHIIDAADFPLSMITNIHRRLDVQQLRSRRRRAKHHRFRHSKAMADLHIIITRADLLAPLSEQVDKLMPIMVEALRDALGSKGQRLRLGNVHMVSAHRGWRTRDIKEQIWKHGGAVWMVGKTNVGKSNLINQVFPKTAPDNKDAGKMQHHQQLNDDDLNTDSLLPPPQKIVTWPILPVTSRGPGTTASPIRIPFGGKRGEVIDLPGLNRNSLEEFVKEKHRLDLVATNRAKPDRISIKPGESLLLDQLIRITPLDPDLIILAAPFVPLSSRVVPTEEAEQIEKGERKIPTKCIANNDAPAQMASAGTFELKWDVTRIYGDERHMKGDGHVQLYRLMSVDILIEGSGWVELLCQVRTKHRSPDNYPKVEIFSPKGQFVGSRRSLSAWRFILEKEKKAKKQRRKRLSQRLHGHPVDV